MAIARAVIDGMRAKAASDFEELLLDDLSARLGNKAELPADGKLGGIPHWGIHRLSGSDPEWELRYSVEGPHRYGKRRQSGPDPFSHLVVWLARRGEDAQGPISRPVPAPRAGDWLARNVLGRTHADRPAQDVEALVGEYVDANHFVTTRGLEHYESFLEGTFLPTLLQLSADETWIDFGAGAGVAGQEYLERCPGGGRYLGLSFRWPLSREELRIAIASPRFEYQEGDLLEADPSKWPSAKIATDLYGPLSYSTELSAVLERELSALIPGGRLYVHMANVEVDAPETTLVIVDVTNRRVPLEEFFGAIRGAKLDGPIARRWDDSALVLKRLEGPLEVPTLRFLRGTEGSPPYRTFVWPR